MNSSIKAELEALRQEIVAIKSAMDLSRHRTALVSTEPESADDASGDTQQTLQEQLSEFGEIFQDFLKKMKENIDENPAASIFVASTFIALTIGVILGRLTRGSS